MWFSMSYQVSGLIPPLKVSQLITVVDECALNVISGISIFEYMVYLNIYYT